MAYETVDRFAEAFARSARSGTARSAPETRGASGAANASREPFRAALREAAARSPAAAQRPAKVAHADGRGSAGVPAGIDADRGAKVICDRNAPAADDRMTPAADRTPSDPGRAARTGPGPDRPTPDRDSGPAAGRAAKNAPGTDPEAADAASDAASLQRGADLKSLGIDSEDEPSEAVEVADPAAGGSPGLPAASPVPVAAADNVILPSVANTDGAGQDALIQGAADGAAAGAAGPGGGPVSGDPAAAGAVEAVAARGAKAASGKGRADTESGSSAAYPAGPSETFLSALADAGSAQGFEAGAPGSPAAPVHGPAAATAPPAATAAAPAAPAAPPPVPIGQVPMTVGLRSLAGSSEFQIRLDPAELGRIDVKLAIDKARGTVATHLVVDRVETLALLQRDAGQLQQALIQAGLDPSGGGINLSLRGDGGGAQGGNDPRGGTPTWTAEPAEAVPEAAPLRALRGYGGLDIRI